MDKNNQNSTQDNVLNDNDLEQRTVEINDVDEAIPEENEDAETTELTSTMLLEPRDGSEEEKTVLINTNNQQNKNQQNENQQAVKDEPKDNKKPVIPYNGDPSSFKPLTSSNIQIVNNDNLNTTKKSKKVSKKIIAFVAVIVLIGAGIGTYFALFTPEKRLARYLEKGNAAVETEQYNVAIEFYEKALELDDVNLEAMLGNLKAHDELGDADNLKKLYEEYCSAIRPLASSADADTGLMAEIYLMANNAYADDIDARVKALKDALSVFPDNKEIKDSLINDYFIYAESYADDSDFENVIKMYNEILSLDASNATAINERKACAEAVLDGYVDNHQYDEAYAFIDAHKDVIPEVDFNQYTSNIDNLVKLETAFNNVMSATIDYLSNNNYDAMLSINGSMDAVTVYNNIGDYHIFAPDGTAENFTGKAAAMYKMGDGTYYFYYGDFVDGMRSGYGVSFIESSIKSELLEPYNAYMVYEGEWANDKPNGAGTLKDINKYTSTGHIDIVVKGQFKDGLQHGEMSGELFDVEMSIMHYAKWTATDGMAPDIKEEYIAQGYDFEGREDKHIYAVYIAPDSDTWWNLALPEAEYLGVFGFNKK